MTVPVVDPDLVELAASVFADATDDNLWDTLEQTGLARLAVAEDAGGSGGSLLDLAAVLVEAGAAAAWAPLAETDLACRLAATAGLEVPAGPLTFALDAPLSVDRDTVSGTLARVPWGRSAAAVVALGGGSVVVLDPATATVVEGTNVAEEPRDTLTWSSAAATVAAAPDGAAAEFALRAALSRSLLLAGAARGALTRAVGYAGEREQFGRPIGRFQAIQQQLALAAAEVAAGGAAAESAARVVVRDGITAPTAELAVAAAKVRTGQAATEVARVAHQVHGAIGFTREHDLRLTTTRLWAWRDEDGTDGDWAQRIGDLTLAAGADGLWPLVTA
ncbi:acyl-CoA dehydrogenase [Pseudonocardia sulfidoxydans NBRC 16205]|uniref:Acyl-CoA dehydrogenase n=1 Tax=Pseudonocardia sulfidoxydans NBRC 16205 TaxID=1223511 RepID=A0A511D929_9PSEU|nr:acyl-CoA dehydrogenase family protein [Pseudonocardia sulfidoxydans]GEL21305.1 acyl-CoA dehydrogenase [Pseudonocardia sulfidoxydans NBRC 16205]